MTDVIAGPYGHWYTLWHGELLGNAQTMYGTEPPPTSDDLSEMMDAGWYGVEDLAGEDRASVLRELTRA